MIAVAGAWRTLDSSSDPYLARSKRNQRLSPLGAGNATDNPFAILGLLHAPGIVRLSTSASMSPLIPPRQPSAELTRVVSPYSGIASRNIPWRRVLQRTVMAVHR